MARSRKLFPIYGSTFANHMLTMLVHDKIVAGFVASYVADCDRRSILGGPARDRELADTIGREIILAVIVETREALPRFYGKQKLSKLKPEEREAIDAFFRELVGALDRAQHWSAEDRRQFRRDLAMYSDFRDRQSQPAKGRKAKKGEEEPPFVARVAVLLDPSMLEQARRAAQKFHSAIPSLSRKLLRRTLG